MEPNFKYKHLLVAEYELAKYAIELLIWFTFQLILEHFSIKTSIVWKTTTHIPFTYLTFPE